MNESARHLARCVLRVDSRRRAMPNALPNKPNDPGPSAWRMAVGNSSRGLRSQRHEHVARTGETTINVSRERACASPAVVAGQPGRRPTRRLAARSPSRPPARPPPGHPAAMHGTPDCFQVLATCFESHRICFSGQSQVVEQARAPLSFAAAQQPKPCSRTDVRRDPGGGRMQWRPRAATVKAPC
jgi:hypothetical protein